MIISPSDTLELGLAIVPFNSPLPFSIHFFIEDREYFLSDSVSA